MIDIIGYRKTTGNGHSHTYGKEACNRFSSDKYVCTII